MLDFCGAFENPVKLAAFYDETIREQTHKLYNWQVKALLDFKNRPSGGCRRIAVKAANGSGKSKYLVSLAATWMAVNFKESQTVVTSASGSQLDRQTARYIKSFAEKMNAVHKEESGEAVWIIRYRDLIFLPNNSRIDLFATDESGQAEGWHPIVAGGEFAVIVDEAKTVSNEIFDALDRCNGQTRRLDVSSPGGCTGHFYDICTRPDLGWSVHTITAFDCPHIRNEEIQYLIAQHGLHDPLVRSSLFAEFSSFSELVVIGREIYQLSQRLFIGERGKTGRRAGLDLAAGGDENVLSVWDNNIQIAQECFRATDTVQGSKIIIDLLSKHSLKPENVHADDGGIGRGMLDYLKDKGWPLRRVMNQGIPFDKSRYANRGAELWFNLKRFVEEYSIKFLVDKTLEGQLTNRYYRIRTTDSKIVMESKPEAKAKGHPSPDRADAAILAWAAVPFESVTVSAGAEIKKDSRFGVSLEELQMLIRKGDLAGRQSGQRAAEIDNIYVQQNYLPSMTKFGGRFNQRN